MAQTTVVSVLKTNLSRPESLLVKLLGFRNGNFGECEVDLRMCLMLRENFLSLYIISGAYDQIDPIPDSCL
jgi:hypothetical protein